MSISLNVKSSAGPKFVLEVPSLDETIGAFKVRLAEVSNIPADSQRLIFRGHVLKDAQTFHDIKAKHGLESGQTMHVVRGGAPRTASTSSSTAPASSTSPTSPVPPGSAPQQTPQATPGGANPFNMFRGGAGAMGGFGDMAEMQRQLMQNPEHFQAFMNSPLMESIMNNPDVAREIMMTNPQLRELIERNPEVGHVFNDPGTFRQMMQIARNPSLMNEMMRNTDRQMANIEMMPGGFDALRRMQENIQGPLMDAVQNGFGGNQDNANANGTNTDNPFTSLFQNTPSNTPMPNPWAPNNGVPQPAANTTQNAGSRDANVPPVAGATPPTGNAFANMFGGAGAGGGFPGMPGGGDPDQMLQMLDNPMVQQMMQNLLSDPQVIEAMIASNPQLQAMVQANPEMANMLRNPALMRSMFNPDFIRGIMQMRNAMGGAGFPAPGTAPGAAPGTAPGAAPGTAPGATPGTAPTATAPTGNTAAGTTPATTQTPPATGTAPAGTGAGTNTLPSAGNINGLMAVLNAMRGLGQGQTPTPQPEMTQEQLEEMYSSQLTQLREMGFLDTSMCLQALRQSGGNVALAVENLLNRFGG